MPPERQAGEVQADRVADRSIDPPSARAVVSVVRPLTRHLMTYPVRRACAAWVLLLLAAVGAPAAAQPAVDADDLLRRAVFRWMELAQPATDSPRQAVAARFTVARGGGLPAAAAGATLDLAYQWPDRLRATARVAGEEHRVGRDGQQLWVHQPGKKFGLVGRPGVRRFAADPASVDQTALPPFELPFGRLKARAVLLAVDAEHAGREWVGGADCTVLRVALLRPAAELIGAGTDVVLHVWLRDQDLMPMRLAAADGKSLDVRVDTASAAVTAPPAGESWRMAPNDGDKVETVALGHLTRMMDVGPRLMNPRLPPLGPAAGERRVVARSGDGRLELHDGTRVLFLAGGPEEMGRQHGELLKNEIRDVAEKVLYGVGVGSSFYKGTWFFGEIEAAQSRVEKFVDSRVLREMDALADAAGVHRQESRLANFFPELFHCSGFALLPGATADGHVYHGRVLDYLRGVGLEQNAVVTVYRPTDGRHAWVNLSYAGFVGSVTAMNEHGISVGEMGGRGGYGRWDGKPMAQLVREVMEQAATLDEAVAILRAGPRTCEYYYVVADGKAKRAVGIGATPDTFEVVGPGEAHPKLPAPVPDTVLVSAGDRYDVLARRAKDGRGSFDVGRALELMTRPVCMSSNIQSALFIPDTLDFHVANADGRDVASHSRYTRYNLRELLRPEGGRGDGRGVSRDAPGGERPKAARPRGF